MDISLRSSRVFLLISLVLVLSLFFLILSPFLTPILLALVAGTLFYPLYQRLDRRLGTRPNLSSLCLCVIITFLIVLPLCLLAVRLASETQQALLDYQQSIEAGNLEIPGSSRLLAFWNRLTRIPGIPELDIGASAQAAAREVVLFLVRNSSAILAGLAGFVADFFIMLFTLFFVLRDGESFLNELLQLVPLDTARKCRMVSRFKETIFATFFGSFVTAAAQGMATWVILWILGFQNAFLWGTLAAVTSLIPLVGASLVWIPASVYLLVQASWARGIVLLVYGALVISLLDNILRPLVIQRTSQNMHTLLIFLGILGGMAVFGFSGFILGPVIVAFTVTIVDMVKLEFRDSTP